MFKAETTTKTSETRPRYDSVQESVLKSTPIPEILRNLTGNSKHYKYMYFSPFREENTGSVRVNTEKNLWVDFGFSDLSSIPASFRSHGKRGEFVGGDAARLVELYIYLKGHLLSPPPGRTYSDYSSYEEALDYLASLNGMTPSIVSTSRPREIYTSLSTPSSPTETPNSSPAMKDPNSKYTVHYYGQKGPGFLLSSMIAARGGTALRYSYDSRPPEGAISVPDDIREEAFKKVQEAAESTGTALTDMSASNLASRWAPMKESKAVFIFGTMKGGIPRGSARMIAEMATKAEKKIFFYDTEANIWIRRVYKKDGTAGWTRMSAPPALPASISAFGPNPLPPKANDAIISVIDAAMGKGKEAEAEIKDEKGSSEEVSPEIKNSEEEKRYFKPGTGTVFLSSRMGTEAPRQFNVGVNRFSCVEHYLMYASALLNGESALADNIVAAEDYTRARDLYDSAGIIERDDYKPLPTEELARSVYLSFRANIKAQEALVKTGGKEIVPPAIDGDSGKEPAVSSRFFDADAVAGMTMRVREVFQGENIVPESRREGASAFKILNVGKISSSIIINYAASRGISEETLNRFCMEAKYTANSNASRPLTGLFFPNRLSGDTPSSMLEKPEGELRGLPYRTSAGEDNLGIKMSCGEKEISVLSPSFQPVSGYGTADESRPMRGRQAVVFEGVFDAMSWVEWLGMSAPEDCDIIVLNSTSLAGRALEEILSRKYTAVTSFLDNDNAGKSATDVLQAGIEEYNSSQDNTAAHIRFTDGSILYRAVEGEDLNSHYLKTKSAIQAIDSKWEKDVRRPLQSSKAPTLYDPTLEPINIHYSSDEGKELSNMSWRPFNDSDTGKKFCSVEQYYQYMKAVRFGFNEQAAAILSTRKSGEAKSIGGEVNKMMTKEQHAEWMKVNADVMYSGLKQSFNQNKNAKEALLSTGMRKLTHNQDRSIWHERFPELLMRLRLSYRLDENKGIVKENNFSQITSPHLFAPNGQPSNLSKDDYDYIRSRVFKSLAGDWESARIVRQARTAWNNEGSRARTNFVPSEKFVEEIKSLTGLDIRLVVIADDRIRHIKNSHGQDESSRGQVEITPEDIAVIPYLINNFDSIERAPQYDDKLGGMAVTVSKRINGISYVGTINKGEKNYFVVTAWQKKKSAALDAPKDTPGLYVQNDTDLSAKVNKDIENIKLSTTIYLYAVDENGEPTPEVINAFRRVDALDMAIAQEEAKIELASSAEEKAISRKRIEAIKQDIHLTLASIPKYSEHISSKAKEYQAAPGTNYSDASRFVCHSGGALGADTIFGELIKQYGGKVNHYWYGKRSPEGNVQITEDEYNEGVLHVHKANETLKRKNLDKYMYLLARDWSQVKNADAVFAVGHLSGPEVDGGTGWAVRMATDAGKPVYVYDLDGRRWVERTYGPDGSGEWKEMVYMPQLTQNFAGIGSRDLPDYGKEEIKKLFEANFGPVNSRSASTEAKKKPLPIITAAMQQGLSREQAEKNENALYLFTDNTDRTSGRTPIDMDSDYYRRYGNGTDLLFYPTKTTAILRGLDNSMPLSSQRWCHPGAYGSTGRWNDEDAEEFKENLANEVFLVKAKILAGAEKYKLIYFPHEKDSLTKGSISALTPERTPKLYEIAVEAENSIREFIKDVNTMRATEVSRPLPGEFKNNQDSPTEEMKDKLTELTRRFLLNSKTMANHNGQKYSFGEFYSAYGSLIREIAGTMEAEDRIRSRERHEGKSRAR